MWKFKNKKTQTQAWMNDTSCVFIFFSTPQKDLNLPKSVSYSGALKRALLLYWASIIRKKKRTIFAGPANHLCEKEWVATSSWTVEMEQELGALSHHMLMAAINSQLHRVLEHLDKCRCTLQLARGSLVAFP